MIDRNTLVSKLLESERLQRKRPTFISGVALKLYGQKVRKSGLKREKPLRTVLTRQNFRALLRTEAYKRAAADHPDMKRSDRRKLARALAAKQFKEASARVEGRELPKAA